MLVWGSVDAEAFSLLNAFFPGMFPVDVEDTVYWSSWARVVRLPRSPVPLVTGQLSSLASRSRKSRRKS